MEYRALFMEYRALLMKHRALFVEYRALFHMIWSLGERHIRTYVLDVYACVCVCVCMCVNMYV